MFGNNPVRKQELRQDGALWVSEIFATIQGEGPLAGTPAIFIRLSGCNLRCDFCDTDFESVRHQFTVEEISRIVRTHSNAKGGKIGLAVITGGEPFLQNIVPLIVELRSTGFEVQIETAGTVSIQGFPWYEVTVVVSPKTGKVHPQFHLMARDWKYVISASHQKHDPDTELPMLDSGKPIATPARPSAMIWVQPMDEYDPHKNKRNVQHCIDVVMRNGYRISLQTHKILGVE